MHSSWDLTSRYLASVNSTDYIIPSELKRMTTVQSSAGNPPSPPSAPHSPTLSPNSSSHFPLSRCLSTRRFSSLREQRFTGLPSPKTEICFLFTPFCQLHLPQLLGRYLH